MRLCTVSFLVIVLILKNCFALIDLKKDAEDLVVEHVINECLSLEDRYSCFAEKAAIAVERSMDWDIQVLDGVNFVRNKEKVILSQGRSLSGLNRFTTALANFFFSHTLSMKLSDNPLEERAGGGGGGGGGFGGGYAGLGSFGIKRKDIRKEAKYMRYAFMVLLGIFGLTGPLVMKTLALIAGKALLASKAALLIVGGVALKKIFEHNDHHEKPTVKVHTIPSYDHGDGHDRMGYSHYAAYAYNPYPYEYSRKNT